MEFSVQNTGYCKALSEDCRLYDEKSLWYLRNSKGRVSYKIFSDKDELSVYLKKNNDKKCKLMKPVFTIGKYIEYPNTQVRRLNSDEIELYMSEQNI